jgi:hypothetical protein
MPTIVRDYQEEILATIREQNQRNKWWSAPINLGGAPGPSGGSGTPIGGTFGQLPQTRVAYDTTEAAYSGIQTNVPSGTLYDNLSHIRYRLGNLETASGSGSITLQEDDVEIASNVTIINFEGSVSLLDEGSGKVTVTISGTAGSGSGGHIIQNEGSSLTQRSKLNFVGNTVSVTDDAINDATIVSIQGSTGGGTSSARPIFEDVSSQIPAVGNVFTVSEPMISGTLRVHFNGLLQRPSYYLEESSTSFSTSFTPVSGEELIADYLIASGGGILSIELRDEGSKVGDITTLDFVGASVQASVITSGIGTISITASGAGHTIQDEGSDLTQRSNLNFVGSAVTVTDDSGNDATVVTISGGSGTDDAAIHDNVANEISAITEKTTPVDGDIVVIEDSQGSYVKKSLQLQNLLTLAEFLNLSDVTSSSYTGQAGKSVVVNNAETGLEFALISGGAAGSGSGGATPSLKLYGTNTGGDYVGGGDAGQTWYVYDSGSVDGGENWSVTGNINNLIDGDTGTLAACDNLDDGPWAIISLGNSKTLTAVRFYYDTSSDMPDGAGDYVKIYMNNSGTFSGDTDLVAEWDNPPAWTGAGWYEHVFNDADVTSSETGQGQYLKCEWHKSAANWLRCLEVEVKTAGRTLTVAEVHLGVKVEFINTSGVIVASGIKTDYTINEIFTGQNNIDRVKLYDPEGTEFYDTGASWSHTNGGVYVVWPYN